MQFESIRLRGACLIHDQVASDERGSFARIFSVDEFRAHGIAEFVQMGHSRTRKRGTLRGMHFQHEPDAEGKLIRCIRGRVFDAIIDLRRASETFKQSYSIQLNDEAGCALYVPPGFAHGFLTLTDDVEMLYGLTEFYSPKLADGVRWDDPAFAIVWPEPVTMVSERDRLFKDFV